MSQPTVLVTGAAKRIGRAIALDLADHGWQVIIHYNKSQNDAEELASLIRKQGGAAQLIQADLALESQVQDIFPKALSHCRRVDCLINNASTFTKDTAQTTTRGSWDSHLEPNLRAPFVLSGLCKATPEESHRHHYKYDRPVRLEPDG